MKPKAETLKGIGTAVVGVANQTWFDTTAFRPVTEVRFGTTGRNFLRGPGFNNFDFSLFRVFPITERFKAEFRAEAFNFTNTPHFNNPNADSNSTNFGIISGTNANFPERQFRFDLRLTF